MISIFTLPPDVLQTNVLCHLTVREMQAFDTAVTNKYRRPDLRRLWTTLQYDSVDCMDVSSLRWLANAGVMIIRASFHWENEVVVLPRNLMRVKELRLQNWNEPQSPERATDDYIFSQIAIACPLLEHIDAFECGVSVTGVTSLFQLCTQLQWIDFFLCYITDDAVQAICHNARFIKHVRLVGCYDLTDASLIAIATAYPHLQSICLRDMLTIGQPAYRVLAEQCCELQAITLENSGINPEHLDTLFRNNPKLKDITLQHVPVDDICVTSLALHCTALEKIVLTNCIRITPESIRLLALRSLTLRYLEIDNCDNVDVHVLSSMGTCTLSSYSLPSNIEFQGVTVHSDGRTLRWRLIKKVPAENVFLAN